MTQNTSSNVKPFVFGILIAVIIAAFVALLPEIQTIIKESPKPIIGSELNKEDLKYTKAELQTIKDYLIKDKDKLIQLFALQKSKPFQPVSANNIQTKIQFDKIFSATLDNIDHNITIADNSELVPFYKTILAEDVFIGALMQRTPLSGLSHTSDNVIFNNPHLSKIIADTSVLVYLNYSTPSSLNYNFLDNHVKDYAEGLFYLCINGTSYGDIARAKYFLTKLSYQPSIYKEYASAILGLLYAIDARVYPDQTNTQVIAQLKSLAELNLNQAAGSTIPKFIDPDIAFLIGTAYQSIGKDLYAIPWYEKTLADNTVNTGKVYGRLSLMYVQGNGVEVDYAKAFSYADYGTSQNNPSSYYVLGMLHENGYFSSKNINKALSCYKKGCMLGNDLSCQSYDKLRQSNTLQ